MSDAERWLRGLREILALVTENTPALTDAERREAQDILTGALERINHQSVT